MLRSSCSRALVRLTLALGIAAVVGVAATPAAAFESGPAAPDLGAVLLASTDAGAPAAVDAAPAAVGFAPSGIPRPRAPVVVDGRTLFEVGPSRPYTAEERACLVARDVHDAIAAGEAGLEASAWAAAARRCGPSTT